MTVIPESWARVEITQVVEVNNNGKPFQQGWSPQCENFPASDGRWGVLKTTAIQHGEFRDYEQKSLPDRLEPRPHIEVKPGDVLMTCAGPRSRCGVACIVERTRPKLMMSGKMYRFRPHPEAMDSKYLAYFIQLPETQLKIDRMKTGINDSGLNLTHSRFAALRVVAAPLSEQHRIVAKIEELFSKLDKGVGSLKTARAQLKVYRQAVLKQAFEGKLTNKWREENKAKLETPEQLIVRIKQEQDARYNRQLQEWKTAVKMWEESENPGKKPTRPRIRKSVSPIAEEEITSLETLPSSWLWLAAESAGIVQLGRQRSPKNRSKDYPTKYIRAANITEHGLDLDDVLDMDFVPHELTAYRLEKGDLVLSEASGSAAQVGKPAIWEDQIPNCCFQNTIIRHQPYCRDYAVYLLWLYRFFYVSGKFARAAGGVGINHLSAFRFAQIALPLCSPTEQQEIVSLLEVRFAAIEQQEREIDSALKHAESLRQAILKKAFSGRLVAQNPNDEPASKLLERIKVKKAGQFHNATTAKGRVRATSTA